MKNKYLVILPSFCLISNLFAASPVESRITRGLCVSRPASVRSRSAEPSSGRSCATATPTSSRSSLASSSLFFDTELNAQNPGMAASGSSRSPFVGYDSRTHMVISKGDWSELDANLKIVAGIYQVNEPYTPRSMARRLAQISQATSSPESNHSAQSDPVSFAGRGSMLNTATLFDDVPVDRRVINGESVFFNRVVPAPVTTLPASAEPERSVINSDHSNEGGTDYVPSTDHIEATNTWGKLKWGLLGYAAGAFSGAALSNKIFGR